MSQQVVDLSISGMTCASCAARVERSLGTVEGVSATVNLATEKAHVTYAEPVTVSDLVAAVERTGYQAAVVPDPHAVRHDDRVGGDHGEHADHADHSGRGRRVSQIRLVRTQPQWAVGGVGRAVGVQERVRLYRVAEPGPGAVRLDEIHLGGRDPGPQ